MNLSTFIMVIFLCKVYAENANITDSKTSENVLQINTTTINETNTFNDSSIQLEDIIKPMSFVPDEIQINNKNIQIRDTNNKTEEINILKPSPQLEIRYEYNKFPVTPALPEAKHFSSGNGYSTNFLLSDENVLKSTEPPWISRIRFPEKAASIKQSVDQPYPFYLDNMKTSSRLKSSGNLYENRPTRHPIDNQRETNKNNIHFAYDLNYQHKPAEEYENGNKPNLNDFNANKDDSLQISEIPNSELSLKHKWGETYSYTPVHHEQPKPNLSILNNPIIPHGKFPWKKIVKFLTAAVPIGLIISALTPSVITIKDTNATYRANIDDQGSNIKRFVKSLRNIDDLYNKDDCKEKAFCELYVKTKSSKSTETYINNLMEVLNKSILHQTEETYALKRVLDAVRNNNCQIIKCNL